MAARTLSEILGQKADLVDGLVPLEQLPDMSIDPAILAAKADLVGGYVPDTQLPARLSTTSLAAKADLVAGKIPASQLPSYVDDVIEAATSSSLPATGETGKIYVALDTNKVYRWSGSAYVEISASLALGETSSTAYRGDRGKTAYDHSQVTTGNPHGTAFTDITGGYIRLPVGSDATLTSTAHAFQVGPTTGQNLIIDDNEIMVRNNGAAAALALNALGGDVTINGHSAWHAGNLNPASYLPLAGGTVTGIITHVANGVTTTMSSRNASYFHIESNAPYGVFFGSDVRVNGELYAGATYNQLVWNAGNDGPGSGMDADTVDTYHASAAATANTVALRNASGYLFAVYYNTTASDTATAATSYYVETGGDGYIRPKTLANVKAEIVTKADLDTKLGIWTDYGETWGGITIGNGTAYARYCKIGRKVSFQIYLAFGSTTVVTGNPTVTVPYACNISTSFHAAFMDSGTNYFAGRAYMSTDTSTLTLRAQGAASTYVADATMSATVPFTWAVNDAIYISGTYETNA